MPSDETTPEQKRAFTESMAQYVARLAALGWIERSYVKEAHLRVVLTEEGERKLKLLSETMPMAAWPKDFNETRCLLLLFDLANESPPPIPFPAE